MKKIIFVFVAVAFLVGSFYAGYAFKAMQVERKSEENVAREFPIVERHAAIPSCSEIKSNPVGITLVKNGSDYVLWSYDASEKHVEKAIVTSDMDTIYLVTPLECN